MVGTYKSAATIRQGAESGADAMRPLNAGEPGAQLDWPFQGLSRWPVA